MVTGLGSVYAHAYSDLLGIVSTELRERIKSGNVLRRDILEIARSVIVKEVNGFILVSKNEASQINGRKIEVSNKEIDLIMKICSPLIEKSNINKEKILGKESVSIIRNRNKRKSDDEIEGFSKDELKQKTTEVLVGELRERFSKDSGMPNPILEIISGYLDESSIAIVDFASKKRIPDYLKSITDLDLRKEKVDYDTFCHIVTECKNLQSLKMPRNADDLWFKELADNLPNLKSIYVKNCDGITGVGLEYVASLSLLEKVLFASCRYLTNEGIAHIVQKLENLKELDVTWCSAISDEAFINIGKMSETLISLNLNCTSVSDKAVIRISEAVKGLEKLNLSNCQYITDEGFKSVITNLNMLKELILQRCDISDEGLSNIGKLSETLHILDISFCNKITGLFLTHVDQNFKVMKQLLLGYSNFDGPNLVHFGDKFPALEIIDLDYINDLACEDMKNIVLVAKELKNISLNGCEGVDDDILECIGNQCAKLTNLCINGCTEITNTGLVSIANGCLELTDLSVQFSQNINSNGFNSIIENCNKLRVLKLDNCTDEDLKNVALKCSDIHIINLYSSDVTDFGIAYLSVGVKALQELHISQTSKITSASFKYISKWSNSLRKIYIKDNGNIDNRAFTKFSSTFPNLEYLKLRNTKVGDESVKKFAQLFPSMEKLCLIECNNVTDDGICYLKELPKLSIINLYSRNTTKKGVYAAEIPRLSYLDDKSW